MMLLLACLNSPDLMAGTGASVGEPAPVFTGKDLDANEVSLTTEGTVVLEWFNPGCPFVKYAHEKGGPLDDMAQRWASEGVGWLAINSGSPGGQGTGAKTNRQAAKRWKMDHPILLDESGTIGKLYGASSTPQIAVIHDGTLVYWGGLDNAPRGMAPDGVAINFTENALEDIKAGRPVKVTTSKSYGCSVKY